MISVLSLWLSLQSPSKESAIPPTRGVFERDFFQRRAPEEVRGVFQKVGVEMPDQVFQDVWQEAERRDPHGEVKSQQHYTHNMNTPSPLFKH